MALVAACLIIVAVITIPKVLKKMPIADNEYKTGEENVEYNDILINSLSDSTAIPSPSLSLDGGVESSACYAALEDWRGLPAKNYVIDGQSNNILANRKVFMTLDDLAEYADVFVIIPSVLKTAQDGDDIQSSIAEYAGTIGDMITTHKWDDYTVSTGSRVLIRQKLIGGCIMDEPNNLLRESGIYLLPIRFNEYWGAYEVVGDLDVLFELNDEGKIVSHSQWEGFNMYDGKSLTELVDDVRSLYPVIDTEFIEQPIGTAEQAENQVITAYKVSGYRKFSVEFNSETIIKGTDVYLFKVTFGSKDMEYAAVAKENGAFIRGKLKSDGEMQVFGGLGSFPW